jgi:hypothetical protein
MANPKEDPKEDEHAVFVYGKFYCSEQMSPSHEKRLKQLCLVFNRDRIQNVLVPLITTSTNLSLRLLEWCIINYSRRMLVSLYKKNTIFLIYDNYLAQLRFWKRDLFDAFRRGPRLYFKHKNRELTTTVAQLNFLNWSETNGILDYAWSKLDVLENDMLTRIQECKKLKKSGMKRKRNNLSRNSVEKCIIHEKITVCSFQAKPHLTLTLISNSGDSVPS